MAWLTVCPLSPIHQGVGHKGSILRLFVFRKFGEFGESSVFNFIFLFKFSNEGRERRGRKGRNGCKGESGRGRGDDGRKENKREMERGRQQKKIFF